MLLQFAKYALQDVFINNAKGSDLKSLSQGTINSTEFFLPNIEEQKIIANEYGKLENLLKALQKINNKIYELIDTGICDKLTGVDGAYSQMKIDEIIFSIASANVSSVRSRARKTWLTSVLSSPVRSPTLSQSSAASAGYFFSSQEISSYAFIFLQCG